MIITGNSSMPIPVTIHHFLHALTGLKHTLAGRRTIRMHAIFITAALLVIQYPLVLDEHRSQLMLQYFDVHFYIPAMATPH